MSDQSEVPTIEVDDDLLSTESKPSPESETDNAPQPTEEAETKTEVVVKEEEPVINTLGVLLLDPEIMAMKVHEVQGNIVLINRAIDEYSNQAGQLRKKKAEIDEHLKQIGKWVEYFSKYQQLHETSTDQKTKERRHHIDTQNRIRREKAERAKTILQGLTPAQLAAVTDPRSPIDRAKNMRKPGHGAGRKIYPLIKD